MNNVLMNGQTVKITGMYGKWVVSDFTLYTQFDGSCHFTMTALRSQPERKTRKKKKTGMKQYPDKLFLLSVFCEQLRAMLTDRQIIKAANHKQIRKATKAALVK